MLLHLPDGLPSRAGSRRPRREDPDPARDAAGVVDLGPGTGDARLASGRLSRRASTFSSATRTRPGSAAPTRTPTGCCASTSPRAAISPCIPRPSWTGSPPNSTTGPANGSDSANRSNRSLTCFWLPERSFRSTTSARPHLYILPRSGQPGCRAGGVQMEPPQPRSGEEERP